MKTSLALRISDKEFNVTCEADKKTLLIDAAQLVNQKMDEIKQHGKTVGSDRIATMVALNLATDLLALTEDSIESSSDNQKALTDILYKIESTMDAFKQLQQ